MSAPSETPTSPFAKRRHKNRTPSLYLEFDRAEWQELAESTPLPLTEDEITDLQGIGDSIDVEEVKTVYLPLSRLLNLYASGTQHLWSAQCEFLRSDAKKVPFIIAVSGSVAVGKSTTARLLQALLSRWPDHPRVELVTTDGFLYPNAELERRSLMDRKGFPESYDRKALIRFVGAIKAGRAEVAAPVYSHLVYDVIPDQQKIVRSPDILIIEGLNVLQQGDTQAARGALVPEIFLSDLFDFSVYVDAPEPIIKKWYLQRFQALRETAFRDPSSFFRRFAEIREEEALMIASDIWDTINGPNLRENIAPTRSRARLILSKGANHEVERIRLRRI